MRARTFNLKDRARAIFSTWEDVIAENDSIVKAVVRAGGRTREQMLCSMVMLLCFERARLIKEATKERMGKPYGLRING
jgi:hypothetical protein